MRWRVRAAAAVAATLATSAVVSAGCAQTVGGTAVRGQPTGPDRERSYGYADDRCGLLVDGAVQDALGADDVVRPYSGAVCQYVLSRESSPGMPVATLDVTFSWFEAGNLHRERALATARGAAVRDSIVERQRAFTARRDVTGAACAATAAVGTGVLSWWVQFRGGTGDPCPDAVKLLSATLRSDM